MILSDRTIRDFCIRRLGLSSLIEPFNKEQLQPASYDLLLGEIQDSVNDEKVILPKEFLLASTIEKVNVPNTLVGRLEGKSSWARKGLIIHAAGFIDPGFSGTLTLEVANLSNQPILLRKGFRICQISFHELDKPAERPYGHKDLNSHYQNQNGITASIN